MQQTHAVCMSFLVNPSTCVGLHVNRAAGTINSSAAVSRYLARHGVVSVRTCPPARVAVCDDKFRCAQATTCQLS